MAEPEGNAHKQKRWREPLRLLILKEDTHEEVGSYKLSLLNFYLLTCSVLLITIIAVVALIFFTPAKRLVPGYAEIENNREYMAIYQRVERLERELQSQSLYTDRFRNLITQTIDTASEGRRQTENLQPGPKKEVIYQNESPDSVELSLPSEPVVKQVKTESSNQRLEHLYLVPPVKGTISAGFNESQNHFGIDVLAPHSTPIKAILDGYVFFSDWTLETGNTIGIQHSNNMVSVYKHNSALLKKMGNFVKAGEAVAVIGNTGTISSGPHLHFELWLEGHPIDPLRFINFQ